MGSTIFFISSTLLLISFVMTRNLFTTSTSINLFQFSSLLGWHIKKFPILVANLSTPSSLTWSNLLSIPFCSVVCPKQYSHIYGCFVFGRPFLTNNKSFNSIGNVHVLWRWSKCVFISLWCCSYAFTVFCFSHSCTRSSMPSSWSAWSASSFPNAVKYGLQQMLVVGDQLWWATTASKQYFHPLSNHNFHRDNVSSPMWLSVMSFPAGWWGT